LLEKFSGIYLLPTQLLRSHVRQRFRYRLRLRQTLRQRASLTGRNNFASPKSSTFA
jgi:hypothetical protein